MNRVVKETLIELFEHLADAADGEESLPRHLEVAYRRALRTPEMMKFYGDLVRATGIRLFGK